MSSNGGSYTPANNGGSNIPTANQGNERAQLQMASAENARLAIAMMEKTGDRLLAAMQATHEDDVPPLLEEMYNHYVNIIDALSKAVNNEATNASDGVLSFEGHDAINQWENAGHASDSEAWSMRHFLDNYFQSRLGV